MIELENIYAGYGKKNVLFDMSFAAEKGKITAIIGPNGSGKSTLLKVMAGIITAAEGVVRVDGKDAAEFTRKELAQSIAYLSQGRRTPDMTVGQMVLLGRFPHLSYPRRYGKKDRDMAFSALRKMGISELYDRELSSLSGGMRQNAYIAMALAQDAEYILLDEPTTYLDISHRISLMKTLCSLAETGKGLIAVMHDIPLALSFSDNIIVIDNGRLVCSGTPGRVCESGILKEIFDVSVCKRADGKGYCYEF